MSWFSKLFSRELSREAAYPKPSPVPVSAPVVTPQPKPLSPVVLKIIAIIEAGQVSEGEDESGLFAGRIPMDGSLPVFLRNRSLGSGFVVTPNFGGFAYGTEDEGLAIGAAILAWYKRINEEKRDSGIAAVLAYQLPEPVKATD